MPLSGRGPPNTVDRENYQDAAARAASKPLEFDPKSRASYVRAMVNRVIECKRESKTVAEIQELLPEFVLEYKHLFELLTAPEGYDQTTLNMMLSMLDRMGSNNLSQHEASVVVGKRLFEKFGNDKH